MPDPKAGSGSGEYSALLLATITEVRDDHRAFRTSVEKKMDDQGEEIKQILISLADGTGRMNVMQQTIDTVKTNTETHDRRLRSIEAGSGMHAAVTRGARAVKDDDDEKPKGGWISADKIPAIITALGSLIAVVISSVALMRQPAQPLVASNTPATTTTPTPTTHNP